MLYPEGGRLMLRVHLQVRQVLQVTHNKCSGSIKHSQNFVKVRIGTTDTHTQNQYTHST